MLGGNPLRANPRVPRVFRRHHRRSETFDTQVRMPTGMSCASRTYYIPLSYASDIPSASLIFRTGKRFAVPAKVVSSVVSSRLSDEDSHVAYESFVAHRRSHRGGHRSAHGLRWRRSSRDQHQQRSGDYAPGRHHTTLYAHRSDGYGGGAHHNPTFIERFFP